MKKNINKYKTYSRISYLCFLFAGTFDARQRYENTVLYFMKIFFRTLMSVVVAILMFCGCNDDLFVEKGGGPSSSILELSAGNDVSVSFDTKNLRGIYVYVPECELPEPDAKKEDYDWTFIPDELGAEYPLYWDYDYNYDAKLFWDDGTTKNIEGYYTYKCLWDAWDSALSRRTLQVENAFLGFKIRYDGDNTVTVMSPKNLTDKTARFKFELSYIHKDDTVHVTIPPLLGAGNRYVVSGIEYDDEFGFEHIYKNDSIPFSMFNNSSEKVPYKVSVEDNSQMYVSFKINPKLPVEFADNSSGVRVEIPTYKSVEGDGGSIVEGKLHGETVGFSLDTVVAPAIDSALGEWLMQEGYTFSKVYTFRVSPGVGVKGFLTIQRLIISAIATLKLRNVDTDYEIAVPVKVDVSQPWFYSIKYERIENEADI
ncbi:hypothetical protein [uncultured Duncaniella sp.]|uniref:hypothetical protein n=2 Tax=uncultured Duncaniella sp. TaxID=2768039 RepID=UPI0026233B78|nr:hypothetical protein [uncultured Duncaniella sp.]